MGEYNEEEQLREWIENTESFRKNGRSEPCRNEVCDSGQEKEARYGQEDRKG